MSKRLLGVLLVTLILLPPVAPPAAAVEEGTEAPAVEEEPEISEICREGTQAAEFCPEAYREPSWFQWLLFPLLVVGILMAMGLLFFYLVWQPRFAEERRSARRR